MSTAKTDLILGREQQRCNALLNGDAEALSELLSDRLVFAHANATHEDKASLLKKMAAGNIVYKTLKISEERLIDLGESVLLFSRLTAAVTVGGQPRSIDNYTLSVWASEGNDWRMVAYQPTAIPK